MTSGKSLQIEVVSHGERLWHGATASIQFPTVDGSLGMLPGRRSLLVQLSKGAITVPRMDEVVSFQVTGRFAPVDSDFATIVVDHAAVAEQ